MAADRSQGIADRASVETARAWLAAQAGTLGSEDVPITDGADRTLAEAVRSNLDLPPFDRASIDGIAVRADETVGASTYNPSIFRCLTASADLAPGAAVRINAGEPLPGGADAVIASEHVGLDQRGAGIVTEPVVAGSGTERRGSQGTRGSTLIPAGRRLAARDIGILAAAGLARISVVRKPRVRCLLSEGASAAGTPLPAGKVYDANGPLLCALIERDGGIVVEQRTIARDRALLRHALLVPGADIVLVAGGTGSGGGDHAAVALAEAGELAIHGVALRHAESAGMGIALGNLVLLLPGTPVACLLAYEFLAGPAIRRLGGRNPGFPFPIRKMTITRKIVSEISMTELWLVRCPTEDLAEPIAGFAEAGLKAVSEANGFVLMPEGSEGYPQGAGVTVYLYEGYERARS
jgi:molybdopterin molybdotransferase